MQERTLRLLEFDKIVEQVEALASSSLGKELARELAPSEDSVLIREALRTTSEAVAILLEADRVPLGGIYDIRPAVGKAGRNGVLSPQELITVSSTARASRLLRDFLLEKEERLTILPDWAGRLGAYPALEREIDRCIGPGGEVTDNASPKLHSLRSQMKVYQNRIREKLDSLIHNSDHAKYLQEALITVRNERYCIPVKQEFRSLFPGIVHDQSASGATLFIEPLPVVEIHNQLRMTEAEEHEEIERILAELSGRVQEYAESLTVTAKILARIDLAFAKGRYSLAIKGMEPEINTEGMVDLVKARHPLLTGKVVPITLSLGRTFDTLVITGPNTGGKTVTLKTVGLLTVMAQSGLHIPASSGSVVAVFREVFCDIGDEQSIAQSLSTFSSHMTQIVKIIGMADGPDCLVLLDELGAGTDPTEGAALAMSILGHLHDRGVRTVATTHYSELKVYAYKTPGLQNAAVEFDLETLRPTYHLLIGLPGSSQAFAIASKLGLPEPIVDFARSFISEEAVKVEEMLRDIELERRKAREDRLVSEAARVKGEHYKNEYEAALEKLKREKTELIRQAKAEAREVIREARRESENLLRRLREASSQELPAIMNEARKQMTEQLRVLEEAEQNPPESKPGKTTNPAALKPGMRVRVRSLDQEGTILEIGNESAYIQIGIMKVNRPVTDLELREPTKETDKRRVHGSTGGGRAGLETAQTISPEINLLGLTVDDALYQLEKYLDRAVLAGLRRVRIIHGKGTGALRRAIQDYLKDNPIVQNYQFAEQNEGGLGASVAELRT